MDGLVMGGQNTRGRRWRQDISFQFHIILIKKQQNRPASSDRASFERIPRGLFIKACRRVFPHNRVDDELPKTRNNINATLKLLCVCKVSERETSLKTGLNWSTEHIHPLVRWLVRTSLGPRSVASLPLVGLALRNTVGSFSLLPRMTMHYDHRRSPNSCPSLFHLQAPPALRHSSRRWHGSEKVVPVLKSTTLGWSGRFQYATLRVGS